MRQADVTFPLPFYEINKNFKVQSYSKEAKMLFGEQEDLLNLIDEETLPKVRSLVNPEHPKAMIEVYLKSRDEGKDLIIADMAVHWKNELYAEIILIIKDEQIQKVTKTLNQLRNRLNDTNFELLEEKEKLEDAIEQNNQLSAPFIQLNNETALIPIFGDLTADKMYSVEDHLLHVSKQSGTERLLFDFTALGELQDEGLNSFFNMVHSLFYMGLEITFIGVRPAQAKRLKNIHLPQPVHFLGSLKMAINKYCR